MIFNRAFKQGETCTYLWCWGKRVEHNLHGLKLPVIMHRADVDTSWFGLEPTATVDGFSQRSFANFGVEFYIAPVTQIKLVPPPKKVEEVSL